MIKFVVAFAMLFFCVESYSSANESIKSDLEKRGDLYAKLFDISRDQIPQFPLVRLHENDCFPAENFRKYQNFASGKLLYNGYSEGGNNFWIFKDGSRVDVLKKRGGKICITLMATHNGEFGLYTYDKDAFDVLSIAISLALLAFGYKVGRASNS